MSKVKLMIDSGAFSVWKIGERIDLDAYIEFCRNHNDHLHSYINLDVIPGRFGRHSTHQQVEQAAHASWLNYMEMRRAGLSPMVVYHIGERKYWLEKMVKEGCQYIGLGGLVGVDSKRRRVFLDSVFAYLCGTAGYPEMKVHGLGITQPELIHRYPWYSVDSSSWLAGSKTGIIPIPHLRGNRYDFSRTPFQVKISETKKGKADLGTDTNIPHYRNLGSRMGEYVDKYLKESGLELDRLKKEYGYRCKPAAHFLRRCRETHPTTPFTPTHNGFFKYERSGLGTAKVPKYPPKIFLVMPVGGGRPSRNAYATAAVEAGMPYHLFSYLSVRKCLSLENYISNARFTDEEVVA